MYYYNCNHIEKPQYIDNDIWNTLCHIESFIISNNICEFDKISIEEYEGNNIEKWIYYKSLVVSYKSAWHAILTYNNDPTVFLEQCNWCMYCLSKV